MLILRINKSLFLNRIKCIAELIFNFKDCKIRLVNSKNIVSQIIIVGPESLGILIITSCFIGIIFTLQIIKEFIYLNASNFVGAILSIAFMRELSPVLTAIILTGRVSSAFTAELATMKVTEQIDALYLLRINPLLYLILPRLIACFFMLPWLNLLFFITSLSSSIFICSIFYYIYPSSFLNSVFISLSYADFFKSTCKVLIFSFVISVISCLWGLTTDGGAKNVGLSTTSSVVTILLLIFILDCILTHLLFKHVSSIIRFL